MDSLDKWKRQKGHEYRWEEGEERLERSDRRINEGLT